MVSMSAALPEGIGIKTLPRAAAHRAIPSSCAASRSPAPAGLSCTKQNFRLTHYPSIILLPAEGGWCRRVPQSGT
jgi:hypothetical protein